MNNNLKIILEEFEQHKGEFVITNFKHDVQRLIAIGEDDLDYYYVYWNGRETSWESCLSNFIPLKGYIRDEDYQTFINMSKLNHFDRPEWSKSKKDVEKVNNDIKLQVLQEGTGKSKYLTEICWELK